MPHPGSTTTTTSTVQQERKKRVPVLEDRITEQHGGSRTTGDTSDSLSAKVRVDRRVGRWQQRSFEDGCCWLTTVKYR